MNTCTAPKCDRPILARNLCTLHYRRFMRHGYLTKKPPIGDTKECTQCHAVKPIDAFYVGRRGSTCKRCLSILNACRRFKISYTTYHVWLNQQNNRCAVCTQIFDGTQRESTPCLDHSHKTGIPRGFVCPRCNLLLGVLEQMGNQLTPTVLTAAQKYLATPPLTALAQTAHQS